MREIAVQLVQEITGIRLLIEAPDKEAGWLRKAFSLAQLVEKSRSDRSLAGSSQANKCDHAPENVTPRGSQLTEFRFSTHELRGEGQ
jgi:hypothetical protein